MYNVGSLTYFNCVLCRFLVTHISDLHQHVQQSGSRTKQRDWRAILDRVRKQVPLRIVSSCQLASKITAHYRVSLQLYINQF